MTLAPKGPDKVFEPVKIEAGGAVELLDDTSHYQNVSETPPKSVLQTLAPKAQKGKYGNAKR